MTITFDATLDDAVEPSARQFLRSKTARASKLRAKLRGAIFGGAVGAIAFRHWDWTDRIPVCVLFAVIGGALNFFSYEKYFRRRLRKYFEMTHERKWPAKCVFRIEDGHLLCVWLGATIAFPLTSLKGVTLDDERMEVSFGSVGLCTIPLRAFESIDQQEEFTAQLTSEQGAAASALCDVSQ